LKKEWGPVNDFSTAWQQGGHLATKNAPVTPSWNFVLSLPTVPLSCLRRTWWDGVKEDVKCFDLSQEDAQVREKWEIESVGQADNPGSPTRMAIELMICVCLYNLKPLLMY